MGNEVPIDRNIAEDPANWDAVVIKLPAAICDDTTGAGSLGAGDSLSCLQTLESKALEEDLDSLVKRQMLNPGADNVANRPGSYVVLVREWGTAWQASTGNESKLRAGWNGVNWQKYFFCEDWQSPNGLYRIVHMKPSDDPNGRGACYLDYGGTPSPTPSPTPPGGKAGPGTIEHIKSGKCLAAQDNKLENAQSLIVAACDGTP